MKIDLKSIREELDKVRVARDQIGISLEVIICSLEDCLFPKPKKSPSRRELEALLVEAEEEFKMAEDKRLRVAEQWLKLIKKQPKQVAPNARKKRFESYLATGKKVKGIKKSIGTRRGKKKEADYWGIREGFFN